ncbi:MAG: IS21 family transposase [Chloroflexota bacterium]|nr:IS21 family transposase [Chloroflexota bacterium]
MLALEERFMIRDLYRKGVSISEIARRTRRDRKTIRQPVQAPDILLPQKARQPKARKIDPYVSYLEQRMAQGVLNARKLYGEILAQSYPGKESQVREFVHDRRPDRPPEACVRFETAPGEQGQVDWGHFGFISHHGRPCRLYAFIMTLGWSRASYLRFTVAADSTWFIRCHLHAFAYLGGVPKRLLYDNLKSVVVWRDAEEVVHWNPRFLDFADVAGFSPQACKPYRPQTKGKVENGVKYVRGNFWPGLHFQDLDDLNNQALAWLNTTANPRVHGTTGEVPFSRLRTEGLQPADKAFTYDTSVLTSRRSSKDCVISYEGNLYSVPAAYARKTLQVKITEAGELVICSEVGQELARHRVLLGRRERSVQAEHYRGLAPPAPRVEKASASQQTERLADPSLFWDAPVVEVRPLAVYDQLLWEVSS